MATLTKEGLSASLWSILEFGFKCCEKNNNLENTRVMARAMINALVESADNCPAEIVRIPIAHSGKRPEVSWKKRGKR